MPSTINGIGTHYYGQKNFTSRTATCPQCGHFTSLNSYDTRLWFVFIFIPVIPLGKKRIIDECETCKRHYAMELNKWEAQKQLDISGAASKFRESGTPEAAIDMHEALLTYRQSDEAKGFRAVMEATFPRNARVHEYLGMALLHSGDSLSEKHLMRAYELRPDLPNARACVARKHMREGKLDEARQLLDFLQKPGAVQLYDLAVLDELGTAYQQKGRHKEAMELFRHLLSEVPDAANYPEFRQKFETSERALGEHKTTLPKKARSVNAPSRKRTLLKVAIAVSVIVIAMVIWNEHIRRSRTVYIVNGYAQPLNVVIDGGSPVVVPAGGRQEVKVVEGSHRAVVSGGTTATILFEVHSEYVTRWFGRPAWVLNPGGAAILQRTIAIYSRNNEPGSSEYRYGEPFMLFNDVSHPFQPLPVSLSMKSSEKRKTLTTISLLSVPAVDLYHHYNEKGQAKVAQRMAEYRLKARPDDEALLEAYADDMLGSDPGKLAALLKEGLATRPVVVPWHRLYQNTNRSAAREKELIAEYDAMLAAEPGNASLLYLRGRASLQRAESMAYFAKARAVEPANPFVLNAIAYDELSRGNLEQALPLLEAASDARVGDEYLRGTRDAVRVALGKYSESEKSLRRGVARGKNFGAVNDLCTLLASTGRADDALKEIDTFLRKLPRDQAYAARDDVQLLRFHVHYINANLAAAEMQLAASKLPAANMLRLFVLIEQGKIAEAMALPAARTYVGASGFHHLAFCIAWHIAGNSGEADGARERAAVALAEGDADERRAVAMLRATRPPTPQELDEVVIGLEPKALLCTVLGQRFPAESKRFFALALRLNVMRAFPHNLIERAAGGRR